MNGRAQRTQERIFVRSELGSDHGVCGWKDLEDLNVKETLNGGFYFLKKNKILTPHHGCVINWYQSVVTTLGLLGLMDESLKKNKIKKCV
jgi:hypothetical protein